MTYITQVLRPNTANKNLKRQSEVQSDGIGIVENEGRET